MTGVQWACLRLDCHDDHETEARVPLLYPVDMNVAAEVLSGPVRTCISLINNSREFECTSVCIQSI